MQQAVYNLRNLSTMDLSQTANVNTALDVFRPFYDNKQALQDMAFASRVDSEIAKSESDRTKDHGKYYNQSLVSRIKQLEQDYAQDSPESLSYYQQLAPQYFPYQDYNSKILDLYSKFKPSESKTVGMKKINGAIYDVTTTMVGLDDPASGMNNSAEFRRLLEMSLTPLEKQQIYLDGMMRYGRSPEFAQKYFQSADARMADIDNQIKKLETSETIAKTEEEKAVIKANIEAYKDQKLGIESTLKDLRDPDPRRARQAMDNVAGELFYGDLMRDAAKSVPGKKYIEEMKLNEHWKMNYDDMLTRSRMELQHDLNKKLEDYKNTSEKLGSTGYTGDYMDVNITGKENLDITNIVNGMQSAKKQMEQADAEIVKMILKNPNATPDKETINAVKERMQKIAEQYNVPIIDKGVVKGLKDKDGKILSASDYADLAAYNKYKEIHSTATLEFNNAQFLYQQLEEEVKKQSGEDYNAVESYLKLKGGKDNNVMTFTSPSGNLELSLKDMYNLYSQGQLELLNDGGQKIVGKESRVQNFPTIKYKGQELYGNEKAVQDLRYLLGKASFNPTTWFDNDLQDAAQRVEKVRSKVFGGNRSYQDKIALIDPSSKYGKRKIQEAAAYLGIDPNDFTLIGDIGTEGQLAVRPILKKGDDDPATVAENIIKNTRFGGNRVQYDAANNLLILNNSGGVSLMEKYPPVLQKIIQSASTPFDGASIQGQPGLYRIQGSPMNLNNNLPYDFSWDRIKQVSAGPDGSKIVSDVEFNIYVHLGNTKKPISLINSSGTPISINTPYQLADTFAALASNPELTDKLVQPNK